MKLKYRKYFHIETHTNGGAQVVHTFQDEIRHLDKQSMKELVNEYFKLAFSEDKNERANYVMAIVHGSASYLPDLLEYMTEHYPNLTVKNGLLNRTSDLETTTLSVYNQNVIKNYDSGTVRFGPLHQISLVGVAHEEVGGYFPDLLDRLEENPFLNEVLFIYGYKFQILKLIHTYIHTHIHTHTDTHTHTRTNTYICYTHT